MEIFSFFSLLSDTNIEVYWMCMHVVHSQNQNENQIQIHGTHTRIRRAQFWIYHPGSIHNTHIYICMYTYRWYTLKIVRCNPENTHWERERSESKKRYMEIWNGCNFPFASMLHDFSNASMPHIYRGVCELCVLACTFSQHFGVSVCVVSAHTIWNHQHNQTKWNESKQPREAKYKKKTKVSEQPERVRLCVNVSVREIERTR